MTAPKYVSEFKMVVIDPSKEVDTPMEEEEKQQTPPKAETAASIFTVVEGSNRNYNTDVKMNPKVIDILLLDNRVKTDRLQDSDSHKYDGTMKFNPKSFKSGQSVGYIDVKAVSYDLLFTQVRMLKELERQCWS